MKCDFLGLEHTMESGIEGMQFKSREKKQSAALLFLLNLCASFLILPLSYAQNTQSPKTNSMASRNELVVRQINITGQRKIEKDAIEVRLKSKEGSVFSLETVREDIQSIFSLGYFNDVQVDRVVSGKSIDLTYRVVEKPTIGEIVFEGQEDIKADELLTASGLKSFEIFSIPKLRDGMEKMQKLYEDKGFFLAKIEMKVEDLKKDETVKVTFKISENEKVKVKKITFLGNRNLKDNFLKSRMVTTEKGYFSALSGSGAYKQDAFDRDTQMLRYLYFNEGYVQVKIDRPEVYVTPDKKSIYITFRIEEGDQYDVGDIDFSGDLLFSREELSQAIKINQRKIFSYEVLQNDLSELQAKYGDLGYAFANVIPRTRTNEAEKKVDITFDFDKGNKVYFGQITVVGNSKTRDKVVRRELKVREGELYNETRKRKSVENIKRLGFFDDVNFKTSTPPEDPDTLNVEIVVKERNTGSIQLGAGYGSVTGFTLQGQVDQKNFLGKGQKLGAGLNISGEGSYYNLNFTEPYFNDTEWSVGGDVYQSISNRVDYTENKLGGAFRLGHPLGEDFAASLRFKLDKTNLEPVTENGNTVTDFDLFPLGTASGETRSVTGILEFDQRNDRMSPTKGVYASASVEYAGLGGQLNYTKGNATARYFKNIFWDVVWRNNLSYSFIVGHGEKDPPFNELFLLGGPYSLRGYRFFRVGRSAFSQKLYNQNRFTNNADNLRYANRPFGGEQQLLYQMELQFPLIAEAGINGVVFYDIGQAGDPEAATKSWDVATSRKTDFVPQNAIRDDYFYSNVGFGFRWFSPIGPLRFEWGFPLRKLEASPDPVVFEFSIGSPF